MPENFVVRNMFPGHHMDGSSTCDNYVPNPFFCIHQFYMYINRLTREYMQEELVQMVQFKAVELQINKPCHVTVSSVDMLVHAVTKDKNLP